MKKIKISEILDKHHCDSTLARLRADIRSSIKEIIEEYSEKLLYNYLNESETLSDSIDKTKDEIDYE